MVLSSMQLQKVSVTLQFRRLQCVVLRAVLTVFIDIRSAECVCSYYGFHICSQIYELNYYFFAPHMYGVVLRAHPVRSESNIQCNANVKVATASPLFYNGPHRSHVRFVKASHSTTFTSRLQHHFVAIGKAWVTCAQKLPTVAASNNKVHPTRSLSLSPLTTTINCLPGSEALLEVTHQDHSIGITLLSLVRATYIWCMVLLFAHIPIVVNHTFNATPTERLQLRKSNLWKYFLSPVAIGNPERHVRKASHRGSKQ